ncbi:MAG: DNA polymerase Y family protein [Planctomycetes bacterium]|nr:DNA polymerase Y family protein [Planctomycetota bacterium]
MPVAEAGALVQGTLHLEPHDPQADRLALEKLAEWCHQYSPCVGLEDADLPETLLLDVTGIAPLFGSEQLLVEQVERGFGRLRLFTRIGLAGTVGAAWAVAHFHEDGQPGQGPWIIAAGQNHAILRTFSIAALRLPPATVKRLDHLGLQQIGELLLIPRVELQARFGSLLLRRLDQAIGEAAEVICSVQPPPDFSAEWLFECPISHRDAIHQAIEQLVRRLAERLSDDGKGAIRLTCQFDCHPAPADHFEIGLFRPSADPQHLLELVAMQMERIKLPRDVNAVQVRVVEYARLQWRQQEFFELEKRPSDFSQAASLVDRLTSRLGREAVVRCVLQNDAQPEIAYREEPLINDLARQKKSRSTRLPFAPLDRPLHLFERPIRIEVMAVVPEGPPVRFRYRDRDYYIARHWGPERIETGWWRRRGMQRDYYRVEAKTGHRFWLFRRIKDGDWFLHGIFG